MTSSSSSALRDACGRGAAPDAARRRTRRDQVLARGSQVSAPRGSDAIDAISDVPRGCASTAIRTIWPPRTEMHTGDLREHVAELDVLDPADALLLAHPLLGRAERLVRGPHGLRVDLERVADRRHARSAASGYSPLSTARTTCASLSSPRRLSYSTCRTNCAQIRRASRHSRGGERELHRSRSRTPARAGAHRSIASMQTSPSGRTQGDRRSFVARRSPACRRSSS